MSKGREIRCYDYVNHPYSQVRDALSDDALSVFQNATRAASSKVEAVAAELRVNIGGIEVGAPIAIDIKKVEERAAGVKQPPAMRLILEWEAAKRPHLFPFMKAELQLYPLTATETQLEFVGNYETPMGPLGSAVDSLVGHRIAEASVHRFIKDIADYLRKTIR